MKQILQNALMALAMLVLPAITLLTPVPAYAACGKSAASQEVFAGIDQNTPKASCDDSGVAKVVQTAVQILSWVIGVAAIIVIILAGFKYITSGGDAGKVGNAKNTLIYAMIGLAVAVLAQLLVHFVLFQANKAT